jgi:hypothetical protein
LLGSAIWQHPRLTKAAWVDASRILFDDLRSMDDQEARAWDVSNGLIVAGLALVDFGPAQCFHSEPGQIVDLASRFVATALRDCYPDCYPNRIRSLS